MREKKAIVGRLTNNSTKGTVAAGVVVNVVAYHVGPATTEASLGIQLRIVGHPAVVHIKATVKTTMRRQMRGVSSLK